MRKGYLLDTNVISQAAPAKALVSPALVSWLRDNAEDLFLSAISVAEMERGIAQERRTGDTKKATRLTEWLNVVLHLYGERVLAFDVPTARIAGALLDRARSKGVNCGFADVAIGATAAVHELKVLTRNVRHFVPLGVPACDPFVELPK